MPVLELCGRDDESNIQSPSGPFRLLPFYPLLFQLAADYLYADLNRRGLHFILLREPLHLVLAERRGAGGFDFLGRA